MITMCRLLSPEDDENLHQEPLGLADAMLVRGIYLRKLREIVEEDERRRAETAILEEEDELVVTASDEVEYLSTGQSVLRYESYLSHQRYYDDLKHVDYDFIDYGKTLGGGNCIIKQDKSLGKGGFCWDAGFILAEHLLSTSKFSPSDSILELGSGTGLCGIILAKSRKCNVEITDLQELLPLMQQNVALNNFSSDGKLAQMNLSPLDISVLYKNANTQQQQGQPLGSCIAQTLEWGAVARNDGGKKYSMIIGADVVTSLYDPIKLAETIHHLCHKNSEVHISIKLRLDKPHKLFEMRMRELFNCVQIIKPTQSLNKNPSVYIFQATKPIIPLHPLSQ